MRLRRCVVSALDRLAEIEQRADRMATPDPTGNHTYAIDEHGRIAPDTYLTDADRQAGNYDPIRHIAADLRSLVAALRAVLDLHRSVKWPSMEIPGWVQVDICCECSDEETIHWPCDTVRTITEALGGGA